MTPEVSSRRSDEQAVEDADQFFEGRVAIFGEGGGVGEELREALAASSALEDAQRIAAAIGGFFDIHFHG